MHADEVVVDAKMHKLDLRGGVRAELPPFYLSSDRLKLARSARGIEVEGSGLLRFCPCLGSPLVVGFQGGTVAPPGDLILKSPVLGIFGLPVLWLPWFWLRSPTRLGLLPPDLAYRGSDGVFVGGGVHAPWTQGDPDHGIDVRAGGYVQGGFSVQSTMVTPSSVTRVRFDRHAYSLSGENGLEVDARGALEGSRVKLAWDVDATRGARGLYATTDIDVASRPWDRAGAQASLRHGPVTMAMSSRAIARRGTDDIAPDAAGPMMTLRAADDLGDLGGYDATIDAGVWKQTNASAGFARFDAGTETSAHMGPVGARASLRGAGAVASIGNVRGADLAGQARMTLALPLARAFGDDPDSLRHRIEPRVDVAGIVARMDGVLGELLGRGASSVLGEALVFSLGLQSALGTWASRRALEAGAWAGALTERDRTFALLRWRAAASTSLFGLVAEGGHVAAEGHAFVARVRMGRTDGIAIFGHATGRDGIDPVAARALVDASIEAPGGFIARESWSAGGRMRVPFFRHFAISGGADGDLKQPEVLFAVGALEIRDGCDCFVLRVTGAHRLGREGVDVFATLDVAPRPPR